MEELEIIKSICPSCFQEGKIQQIGAKIVEEDEKVWITKVCEKHGPFRDIYFGDTGLYYRWMRYKVTGDVNPDVKTQLFDDPPLYDKHRSQTVLTTLMVTNRCDLRCSYCFMNAGVAGYIYEPTLDQIRILMQQVREERPIGSKNILITGGEPTIREDLFDIVRTAKELGFSYVLVNTNGLKLAENPEYCQHLKDEKVDMIYLSFDGVTKETNSWIEQNKKVINNCRKVNLKICLVPALIGNKNVQDAGKIVRFAIQNMDIVKGINFQPISFCGRAIKINEKKRKRQRVDYAKTMEAIEKEFNDLISRDDFYPVPFVFPISKLIKQFKGEKQIEFTAHPGCGGATYIFVEDGKPIPITRFLNVEGLLQFIDEQSKRTGPFKKLRMVVSFLNNFDKFVDEDEMPKGLNFKQLLKDAVLGGSRGSLSGFHHKSLFVGSMWFQDVWNLNMDRLKCCVIHYTTFEGIVPFCTYNGLGYGDRIRRRHSIPIKEWEEKTGRKLKDDLRKDVPLT